MTAEPRLDRWRRVYLLAQTVLEYPSEQRRSAAERVCDTHPELFDSVWDLVCRSGDEHNEFLSEPIVAPLAATLAPGSRLGPYEILRELGRGGMGQVLLARRADGLFEKLVAIKVVNFADEALRERLRRERQILARLEHPCIARLLDGGESADGSPYLTMEYVEGIELNKYVRQQGLPLEGRLRLFLQICSAVEYAHERQVAHRDLKPSNILVTGDGAVRLLDFGIAKVLSTHAASRTNLTIAGTRQMTPAYASPEQVSGKDSITHKTDIYSLGVVLFELITGQLPYDLTGKTPLEAMRIVADHPPRRPSTLSKEASADLDAITSLALEKEPARRYQSAGDLRRDVERYLQGFAVAARGLSSRNRISKYFRRNAKGLVIAAAAALFIAMAGASALWQQRRADSMADEVHRFAQSTLQTYRTLAAMPDSMDLRAQIAEDATRHLEQLYAQAPTSTRLADEVAQAYRLLSEVQGSGPQHMGDFAAARRSIDRAIEIRSALLARHPDDAALKFEYARDLSRRAAIDTFSDDPRYVATSTEAEHAFDALPADWLSRAEVKFELTSVLGVRSWVHSATGHTDLALATEYRRLKVAESVSSPDERNLREIMLVGDGHLRISVYLYEMNRQQESVAEARKALDLLRAGEPLLRDATAQVRRKYRFQLGATLKGVGKPEVILGHHLAAAAILGEAARACDELWQIDRKDRVSWNCVQESLLWQARALQMAGRMVEASRAADQYLTSTLEAYRETKPGADASAMDTEFFRQGSDWGLPLSPATRTRFRAFLTQIPPAISGRNWETVHLVSKRWLN